MMFPSSFPLFSVSLSGCVFHTLSVRRGDNVTLQCANFTWQKTHVFWFKLTDQPNISNIAYMKGSDSIVTLFDGFQSGKFNMSSDSVTVNLTIKQVNSSDSGLYFCGFNFQNNSVIKSATSLIVNGKIALSLNTGQNETQKNLFSFNHLSSRRTRSRSNSGASDCRCSDNCPDRCHCCSSYQNQEASERCFESFYIDTICVITCFYFFNFLFPFISLKKSKLPGQLR